MWKTFKQSLNTPDSYISLALGLAVVLVVGMITFNYFKAKIQPGPKSQTEQEQAQSVTLPAKHTIKGDETLWSIAEKYYKSGYNWVDIQKANNLSDPNYVEGGQVLTIPDVKPIIPPGDVSSTSTVQIAEKRTYKVVTGDCLWTIAIKMYGDGYKWVNIAQANNLTNPDIIHAGNVLSLP